jgi:hypothetical protein
VGIPVRALVGPPLGCVPLQLFDYFLRGTRQSHFTRAPRIRPSPVRKHRFCEFVVPPLGGRIDGFRLKAGLRTGSCFLRVFLESRLSAASVLALGQATASGLPTKVTFQFGRFSGDSG